MLVPDVPADLLVATRRAGRIAGEGLTPALASTGYWRADRGGARASTNDGIEAEREMTGDEVADYLRQFAEQLDRTGPEIPMDEAGATDGSVTPVVANDSVTSNPPETVVLEIEVESDTSLVGTDVDESVESGLAWRAEDVEEHDEIEIV